jgi:ribonuclease HI
MMTMDEITIYTDGSSLGNPGPGGYGVVMLYGNQRKELFGGFRMTTNNRMEILAAIKALEAVLTPNKKIAIYSDSKLLCDAFNKKWLDSWRAKGWKKADKKPVLNRDLWERLLVFTDKMDVKFVWVKAHVGNPENERCDTLAKFAAEGDDLLVDENYENENAHSGLFSQNLLENMPELKNELLVRQMAGNITCKVIEEDYGNTFTFEKDGQRITVMADALPVFVRQLLEISDEINFK